MGPITQPDLAQTTAIESTEPPAAPAAPRDTHPARRISKADGMSAKRTIRDSLLAEVGQLKSDLEVLATENNRLFQLNQRTPTQSDVPEAVDRDRLVNVLSQHILPADREEESSPSTDWLEAAMNPIIFLPFGRADAMIPLFPPEGESEQEPKKPAPISHHPVQLTAKEELPYLQVFSPLTFTSSVTIVPQQVGQEAAPLVQKHVISVSTPSGLFASTIEMLINTKALSIVHLEVPRLEPCSLSELGPFVEKVIRGKNSSALTRNVSVIAWAMSEWVRLASKRARFWCEVERELGNLKGIVHCAQKMRKGRRRNRVGRPPVAEDSDGDQEWESTAGKPETGKSRFNKADLAANLGRTSLNLDLAGPDGAEGGITLRIQWKIEFDWTGEGQSKTGLLVDAPARCKFGSTPRPLWGHG
jgi:hypothetical protein